MLTACGLGYARDGQQILSGVDTFVGPGESLAAPTSGQVFLDGTLLTSLAGPALGVSLILQGYGLVSLLTAAENVEIALRASGHPPRDARAAARAALADVGLENYANQLIEELSGGQQQRTAVARALALQPRLQIADEPTAELDPVARAVALQRMLEVAKRGGAVVLATHDPKVAGQCDRILDLAKNQTPASTPLHAASGPGAALS